MFVSMSACLAAGAQASMYLAPLLPPACLSACQHVCQHVSMSGRGSASGYVSSPTVCPSRCAQNQHPKLEKERADSELVRKIRVRAHTYKTKKKRVEAHTGNKKLRVGALQKRKSVRAHEQHERKGTGKRTDIVRVRLATAFTFSSSGQADLPRKASSAIA
jgi:hypothetical protein